jgi:crotonobetainyl-CoA:carnitine CoA-transferase CaiB-like acyl-CoA transferase
MDRIAEPTAKFFASHTKLELLEGAVKHRILFYPHFTADNIMASEQLASRSFWVKLAHPELAAEIKYPGAFARSTETAIGPGRRAPLIGEHNREVYAELGIAGDAVDALRREGVI